jgi:hypothetical protein
MDSRFHTSAERRQHRPGEAAPEPPAEAQKPWRLSLDQRDEIILTLGTPGLLERGPSIRLPAEGARKLAGQLLAYAGALDGSAGD